MFSGPTNNHEEILGWATRHDASPAEVRPYVFDAKPSILHFLFGQAKIGTFELRPITWDDFFARFELLGLVMVFDETPYFEILQTEQQNALASPA